VEPRKEEEEEEISDVPPQVCKGALSCPVWRIWDGS
jgi:hypothetical protein